MNKSKVNVHYTDELLSTDEEKIYTIKRQINVADDLKITQYWGIAKDKFCFGSIRINDQKICSNYDTPYRNEMKGASKIFFHDNHLIFFSLTTNTMNIYKLDVAAYLNNGKAGLEKYIENINSDIDEVLNIRLAREGLFAIPSYDSDLNSNITIYNVNYNTCYTLSSKQYKCMLEQFIDPYEQEDMLYNRFLNKPIASNKKISILRKPINSLNM